MHFRRLLVVFIFLCGGLSAQSPRVVEDLREKFRIYDGEHYRDSNERSRVWYLEVNPGKHGGQYLQLSSTAPFAVFVNDQLRVKQTRMQYWSMDSLARHPSLRLALVFNTAVTKPAAALLLPDDQRPLWAQSGAPRPALVFSHFATIVGLLLFANFVFLFRTNPQLMLDYLNFVKLFSVQEREENLVANRITSSNNLFFYFFSALGSAYLLMVLYHFVPEKLPAMQHFDFNTWSGGVWSWLALSCVILIVLTTKLIIINLLSALFQLKETSALQFFNYIRLFFFTFLVLVILCLLYFVFGGLSRGFYSVLTDIVIVLSVIYVLIMYVKLLGRSHFRYFHLFSYLCASEVLPLLVLIRILIF